MENDSKQVGLASNFHILSVGIERAAFYGLRSLIIIYLVSESINMSRSDSLSIFGVFTSALVLSKIIGALIGDLLFGNRTVLVWGGLLQMLGAFIFCIESEVAIYIAITLITIGGGFYSSNLFSEFSKLYKNRNKQLDVGFIAYYLAISAGSFFGVLGIGYLGDLDFKIGFITVGILYLLAIVVLKNNQSLIANSPRTEIIYKNHIVKICVISASIISGIYWLTYDIGYYSIWQAMQGINESFETPYLKEVFRNFNSLSVIAFCIIALVYWKNNYLKRIFKIIAGLVAGLLGFLLLLILSKNGAVSNIPFLLIGLALIGLAEVLISPTVIAIIATYIKSKYLATIHSLFWIPGRLITAFYFYLSIFEYDQIEPQLILVITILILLAITAYLLRNYFIETTDENSIIDTIGLKDNSNE